VSGDQRNSVSVVGLSSRPVFLANAIVLANHEVHGVQTMH